MITFRSPSAHVNYWRKSGNTCRKPRVDLLQCMSPLLAQSGHPNTLNQCLLSGVKRTSVLVLRMSVPD